MKSLRIIVTNRCNAFSIPKLSSGVDVCSFCYRSKHIIETDESKIRMLFDSIAKSDIEEIILTGGDPLVSDYLSLVLNLANKLGLYVTVHTNGIDRKKLSSLMSLVSCVALPLDGSKKEIQDYYRGDGFFEITTQNINFVSESDVELGINTFVSINNISDLKNIAKMVSKLNVRYWLISAYREINSRLKNSDLFYIDDVLFELTVKEIKSLYPEINIFYLKSNELSYPERLWCDLEGNVFIDSVNSSNNILLGNIAEHNLDYFYEKMFKMKGDECSK